MSDIDTNPAQFVQALGEHLLDAYIQADRSVEYYGATEVLTILVDDLRGSLATALNRIDAALWWTPLGQPLTASPLWHLQQGLRRLDRLASDWIVWTETTLDEDLLRQLLADVFDACVTCLTWGGDV